eukprot:CAMPEP_0174981304 /NCGR_PEP_ID=MMETSP0004_2-20121128/15815_1 /TAXON_ID=420556 /ORGANISM="Ochromonas sp., Strain CCMP1393" /LENGTH=68 /DNA_ID=CAMNT_0016233033 /DNA_START=369 /DNA_END=572 /DNA_ORIENTATION=+
MVVCLQSGENVPCRRGEFSSDPIPRSGYSRLKLRMTDFSVDPGEKGQFYGPNGSNIAIPVLNGSIVVH